MVVSMERWKGKVAVITGASSGIGAAIAKKLVEEGLTVVGLARRKEKIEELAQKLNEKSGKLLAVKADISKEDDILQAFKWIKNNVGPVHILVNSAGIYRITSLSSGSTRLWKDVLKVNVLALTIATREAIKDMQENNVDGHIIHINSIGGHRIVDPHGNMCGASKFAVTALAEQLRQELNIFGSKIKVTSVSPGVVRTEIFKTTLAESGLPMLEQLQELLDSGRALQPEDMADAIVYVLSTPPHVQVPELTIIPVDVFEWSKL